MQLLKWSMGIATLGLACAGVAQAADALDTHAFTLTSDVDWQAPSVLLSDANGVTKLDLRELLSGLSCCGTSVSTGEMPDGNGNNELYALKVGLKRGYQITGFSVAATFTGTLNVGKFNPDDIPPGANYTPGHAYAHNEFSLSMQAGKEYWDQSYVHEQSVTRSNLNGSVDVLLSANHLSLNKDFALSMFGAVNASTLADTWWHDNDWGTSRAYMPSAATISMSRPVLTIYSAPLAAVPEPETYAMMLAGLVAVGAVARRRKQV